MLPGARSMIIIKYRVYLLTKRIKQPLNDFRFMIVKIIKPSLPVCDKYKIGTISHKRASGRSAFEVRTTCLPGDVCDVLNVFFNNFNDFES